MFGNNIDNYMRRFVRIPKLNIAHDGSYELPVFERLAPQPPTSVESETLENVVFESLVQGHIIPSLDNRSSRCSTFCWMTRPFL